MAWDEIADLRDEIGDLRVRFDQGFTEMRGKFDIIAAGQAQIVEMLQTLIDREK